MQIRGAIRHRNFSIEKLLELREKLQFDYVANGWMYFKVKKPFSEFERGQTVKVKKEKGHKKITVVEA